MAPGSSLRDHARAELELARRRTAALTDCVDEADLAAQHSPLMSPLVWDLAHVANQEDFWLVRKAGRRPGVRPDIDGLYDAFRHPRATRPGLPLLTAEQARGYGAEVRRQALEVLEGLEEPEGPEGPGGPASTGPGPDGPEGPEGPDGPARRPGADPLLANAFVFGMIAQHEQQHDETMLATHQLRSGDPVLHAPGPPPAPADAASLPREVLIPGGPFTMGTSTDPWALDNERPAHTVELPAFWLDTTPVTNAAYLEFIEAGGYQDPRWWHPEGWAHRQRAGLESPQFWLRDGSSSSHWLRRRFGRTEPLPPDEPVLHVCWYEADAYARWAGRRLPTEAEWEKAARHDPATGRSRRYPWGDRPPGPDHANLGQRHLQPAPAGSYPAGAAPSGARQLLGDVWEWTSSDFLPYPGFAAFPYREYSEVFFGSEYKVLRGGAFGVAPVACRSTFRNWDYPIRRQIFAGFRTARDADAG
ncbi:ergothioneine biosynthesis protein EgtB [Streptomyces sp. YIM 98790]|uniref:ergothioneine biosynthesis protein EgtB n=1 Tax=Streptomyces sp. YIM 98790 TaxID=2689077 RepID=UPI00140CE850|nr:ergothioneine biosynthesis protein EgtB [Streptomyces sp. YIM 98790]